jgi:hypothetical protein
MANENWVGFAKSPKPDPDLTKLVVSAKVEFDGTASSVFNLVTSADGLSSWLHKVEKTEIRTSGKIKFADVAEDLELAVFSLVEIGRKVVINSVLFGELVVVFDRRGGQLEIGFTKMVNLDAKDSERVLLEQRLRDFKARAGEIS